MLLLNFLVWRRDVAARRFSRELNRLHSNPRRRSILEQRTERWARLMMVQQRRLLGVNKED